MRLQHILFYTSRLSLREFNVFINSLDDNEQNAVWQTMNILYARLLKWQAGPSLFQQAMIPDVDSYTIVNNAEMLRHIFHVSAQKVKDSHVFHEHAVLQHVYESLLRSCTAEEGSRLQGDCRNRCNQIFDRLDTDHSGVLGTEEFIAGAVASSHEITKQEATEAFQLMDIDGSGSLSRQEFTQSFAGLCIDPRNPDMADERLLMLKLALSLPSEARGASAQIDAAMRVGRKRGTSRAAVRIQRMFRRSRKVRALKPDEFTLSI